MNRSLFLATGSAVAFNGAPIIGGILRQTATTAAPRGSTFGAQTVPVRVLQNPIVGEIARYDGVTAPPNWAFCDGRILAIAAYPKLFSVIGGTVGGDGHTTFALPRMTGARYIIAIDGIIPRSPAALASMRRGPYMAPDVSVPGEQVIARPAIAPVRPPVAETFPLAWPGTLPSALLLEEQARVRNAHASGPLTPHFRGQPHA